MQKSKASVIAIALCLLASVSVAQVVVTPAGGGGSSTITAGTTATSGCTDGGFLYSLTSLVQCGANAINDGSTITFGGGVTSTGDTVIITNNTSTRNIFKLQDNVTAVLTVADGGNITSTGQLLSAAGTTSLPTYSFSAGGANGMSFNATGNRVIFSSANAASVAQFDDSGNFNLGSTRVVGWSSVSASGNTPDALIGREGAAILQAGADVNGAAVAQTFKAHDGITGTDIAGANLTLAGGRGTGTGAGGNRIDQTSRELATGTTAQTLQDRTVVVAKARTLTEAATNVVLINVASGAFGGGTLEYTVQASDGTDHQARAGSINWAVVNAAGTETCTVSAASELLDGSILAASAGTLTYAITTDTSAANGCYLVFNPVSSLTQTVLNIAYRITGNGGTTTFTAQ